MFYYLDGIISLPEPGIAVVDCSGAGYKCFITQNTRAQIREGERAKLYTYCNVREDAFDIFAFFSRAERSCFEMLIGVSGVGPKAALSILSSNTPENLAMAIVMGNEKTLTAAPGIGKKIAQRIILELKDKMSRENEPLSQGAGFAPPVDMQSSKAADAAAALAVLGYNPSDIASALKGVDLDSLTLEEIIRSSLRKMLK